MVTSDSRRRSPNTNALCCLSVSDEVHSGSPADPLPSPQHLSLASSFVREPRISLFQTSWLKTNVRVIYTLDYFLVIVTTFLERKLYLNRQSASLL